ncbi:MAG: UDP-N-acetylmuramate--L-alanine ligase [Clostridia bacterium]|nr:UDP-N-acetylmuramate--L-alanine ligase [Clostridia bacterium]
MQNIDELLKTAKHIHMIGIGGSGMCPLAEILHTEGYTLTGSDNNESDILKRIRAMGIQVTMGHKPESVEGADMVIHTAAVNDSNPEVAAAKQKGIPTFERSILLGAVSRMYPNTIGVCGTHGKTTVSSMLTQVLLTSGKDPSVVIGGKLPLINAYGRVGKSDMFVCESCEFNDTFLQLSPRTALILNVDADHLEYFKTMDNLKHSFTVFASMAENVIYNGDDDNTIDAVQNISDKAQKTFLTFGLSEKNDYFAKNIEMHQSRATFEVYKHAEKLMDIQLLVPGKHNVYNALAAIAVADFEGCAYDTIKKGVESFGGAGRRFEFLAEIDGITIADDYAHHPAELKVTLEAAMQMGYKRVIAVFQPFTYSRTYDHFDEFVEVLQIPDKCIMSEIMGSREINTYNIYTKDLAQKIPDSVWFNTFEEIADYAISFAQKGDLIITLGCGDIYKAAKIMIEKLEQK